MLKMVHIMVRVNIKLVAVKLVPNHLPIHPSC